MLKLAPLLLANNYLNSISLSDGARRFAIIGITIICAVVLVGVLCCMASLFLCVCAVYCSGFHCWLDKRRLKIARRKKNPVTVDSAVVPVVVVPDTCTSAAESAVKTPAVAEVQKVPML